MTIGFPLRGEGWTDVGREGASCTGAFRFFDGESGMPAPLEDLRRLVSDFERSLDCPNMASATETPISTVADEDLRAAAAGSGTDVSTLGGGFFRGCDGARVLDGLFGWNTYEASSTDELTWNGSPGAGTTAGGTVRRRRRYPRPTVSVHPRTDFREHCAGFSRT